MTNRQDRNEVSYYPEIQEFIEIQLKSNFRASGHNELNMFWGIGELKSNLQRISAENPVECACVQRFLRNVPPLNLDVFALITNGFKFELLILEMKLMQAAGLKEWSQLVGYCLVSGAKYGLLVNINDGASPRLTNILLTQDHVSHISTVVDGSVREHCLGFMEWDAFTQNFEYSNLGKVKSLSDLSAQLIESFDS